MQQIENRAMQEIHGEEQSKTFQPRSLNFRKTRTMLCIDSRPLRKGYQTEQEEMDYLVNVI